MLFDLNRFAWSVGPHTLWCQFDSKFCNITQWKRICDSEFGYVSSVEVRCVNFVTINGTIWLTNAWDACCYPMVPTFVSWRLLALTLYNHHIKCCFFFWSRDRSPAWRPNPKIADGLAIVDDMSHEPRDSGIEECFKLWLCGRRCSVRIVYGLDQSFVSWSSSATRGQRIKQLFLPRLLLPR